MYTTMPPALKTYLLDVYGDPTIPWAWTYDSAVANTTLEEGGFKINPATGYRYWDLDDDNIEDPDEWVELIFYIRWDHPGRSHIGTVLVAEMASVKLRVVTPPQFRVFENVMVEKNFHLYTGGWSLGVEPDHLILWSWDYYWHPGFCYNYGGHNDAQFNEAADKVMYANDQEEAIFWSLVCQYRQAYMCLGIPLYTVSGNKAFQKTNVGNNAEDLSEGEAWEGVVNQLSYGIDNSWTLMNMHTNETPYDNGMVIDWGFSVPEIKQLNPIYATWLYDWNVLDKIYESLLVRNPYDFGELLPWIAKAFHVSEYNHPTYGDCTKIAFTLRDDILWSDGTPLTVADVHFTFIELWQILSARGFPPIWWCPRNQGLLDFLILDAFNFEVLMDAKSYWMAGWVGSNIILPKHIWKPIAETGDPQAFMPDLDLVGSGPFRFIEYNPEAKYILLEANPTFHRYTPLAVNVKANPENRNKFEPKQCTDLTATLENLCLRGRVDNLDVNITITYPNGTQELHQYINLTIDSGEKLNITLPIAWEKGMYRFHMAFHGYVNPDRQWIMHSSCYGRVYVTIKEDIVGSTYYDDIGLPPYPYKDQLPTPDFKVNIKDVARAAKAFGSYPGHERWDALADLDGDHRVSIRDIANIANKFGW